MADITVTDASVRLGKGVEAKTNTMIAGEAIGPGMAVYLKASDSLVYKANAGAIATASGLVGVASNTATAAGDPVDVLYEGILAAGLDLSGESAGAPVYVSAATAGKLTTTAPSGTGKVVAPIGRVIVASDPSKTKVLFVDVPLNAVYAALA